MKPNFLLIGSAKCGTSSLSDLLARHPDVFMTRPREPFFFSHDAVWNRGWDWYESLFANAGAAKARGEGSTGYTKAHESPRAAQRIIERLPGVRLIYIVRHPLERLESDFIQRITQPDTMQHAPGVSMREKRPFNEAIRANPAYIDISLYERQLAPYREHYPADRILVLFFEDFRADERAVIRRCYEFLGVDPAFDAASDWTPRNVSMKRRLETPALERLRRVPGFAALRNAAPESIRGALRSVLKRKVPGRPVWTPSNRRWALEQVVEDSRAFLERSGKPSDFWGLERELAALRAGSRPSPLTPQPDPDGDCA